MLKVNGIIFAATLVCTIISMNIYNHFIRIAPRREPLETPIEVKKVQHPAEEYNWGTRPAYTETVIESIDNVNR
jgi:hypothetical protein